MYEYIFAIICSAFLNGCQVFEADGTIDFGQYETREECAEVMYEHIVFELESMKQPGPARISIVCMTKEEQKEAKLLGA